MPAAARFLVAIIVVAEDPERLLRAIDVEDSLGEDVASSACGTLGETTDEVIGTNMHERPQPVGSATEYFSKRRLGCDAGSSHRGFIEDALVCKQVAQPLELMPIAMLSI